MFIYGNNNIINIGEITVSYTPGIFISYTSVHYQPVQALVYWRKLVLNILALLERSNT